MRLLAVDPNKKVFFSFSTKSAEIQSLIETFMLRLGYGNTDYYLSEDDNNTVAKLIKKQFQETEIVIWTTSYSGDDCYIYMII
jgi:hypothetical protein